MPSLFLSCALTACLLSAFACGAILIPVKAASGGAKKTVWVVDQRHHSNGNLTLYFTNDAVKIDKKNFGYFIVSKAPDWKVYCFRHDDKVMCKLSSPAYLAEQGFRINGPWVESFPKIKDEFIGTVRTSAYKLKSHDDWVAKFPGIPQHVCDLINATAFYQTEPAEGIVLKSMKHPSAKSRKKARLLSLDSENVSGIRIETLKISKAPYKAAEFVVPRNYRPAKLRVILSSVENRREADSIIEQLGLGEKLGK